MGLLAAQWELAWLQCQWGTHLGPCTPRGPLHESGHPVASLQALPFACMSHQGSLRGLENCARAGQRVCVKSPVSFSNPVGSGKDSYLFLAETGGSREVPLLALAVRSTWQCHRDVVVPDGTNVWPHPLTQCCCHCFGSRDRLWHAWTPWHSLGSEEPRFIAVSPLQASLKDGGPGRPWKQPLPVWADCTRQFK